MKTFNTLSVVLGSIITVCLFILFENLFGMLYFSPTNKVILNNDLFTQAINRLPATFYIVLISSNVMACYMGGMLPLVIGDEKIKRSIYIGIIVSLFAILNGFVIPFPAWYKIVSIGLCLPFTFIGGALTKRIFDQII